MPSQLLGLRSPEGDSDNYSEHDHGGLRRASGTSESRSGRRFTRATVSGCIFVSEPRHIRIPEADHTSFSNPPFRTSHHHNSHAKQQKPQINLYIFTCCTQSRTCASISSQPLPVISAGFTATGCAQRQRTRNPSVRGTDLFRHGPPKMCS